MSALAMILTAAMMVPGDWPEKVSGEVRKPQQLDLRGEWRGIRKTEKDKYEVYASEGMGSLSCRRLPKGRQGPFYLSPRITDEGGGKLRLIWWDNPCLAIYEQDGDRLTICFRDARKGRPISFRSSDGHDLLILHRVKPRK
jgi:hypothetical protein